MLTIRLTRKGKKNQPFFRVVVIDKRRPAKGGRAVEDLGYKNPLTKKISLNKERVLYWISKGAKPSDSIHNLLVSEKIIDEKKIHVSKLSKKKQAEISAKKAEVSASAQAPSDKEKPAEPAPAIGAPESQAMATEAPKEEVKPAEEKPV